MKDTKIFFQYVIPSILSFALSGVYSIVDGFFVGNTIGDAGLSAINVAYPLVAALQSIGTGFGMGGAVKYSISQAEGRTKEAREYIAGATWLMLLVSIGMMIAGYVFATPVLKVLGARGELLTLAVTYIEIIMLGAVPQVLGTGLVPFMRNYGGSFWAMVAMISGFVVNIMLDFVFVWLWDWGMAGAALATVIGQITTALIAVCYTIYKKNFTFYVSNSHIKRVVGGICKIGVAPFGLALTPNLSLVFINRFSVSYGGEDAIATYACISYIICVVYLVLQGVGDGSQPLMSTYYGEGKLDSLKKVRTMAYTCALFLAVVGVVIMFVFRSSFGTLFGSSAKVNAQIAEIMPIFLVSVPFVAITRIATASFYATEKSLLSYILTFIEPILMFVLMLILPPLFGGQVMIWWSSVFARILTATLAILLSKRSVHSIYA